jgi:hypothetical protein
MNLNINSYLQQLITIKIKMNQSLLTFLKKVISDVESHNLTDEQIVSLCSFYCNYTSNTKCNSELNTNLETKYKLNFSPDIYDLLTAGITFYKSLGDSIHKDIDINLNTNE